MTGRDEADKANTERDTIGEWRRQAGIMRRRLHPDTGAPTLSSNPMAALDPEFASLVNDFALGGVYASEELDLKSRALCTVAALVAAGEEAYARNWMDNALNVGATPQELVALLRQLFFYIGTPRCVRGFAALHAVLEQRGSVQ
ncbi:MAG TPA: carboxymuconolactone decarboxylase family protein [Acidimicrobiales bacterium]|nr:carboxymuconolactone decarboxylase family protein [Acidimicrobiales bacterium]